MLGGGLQRRFESVDLLEEIFQLGDHLLLPVVVGKCPRPLRDEEEEIVQRLDAALEGHRGDRLDRQTGQLIEQQTRTEVHSRTQKHRVDERLLNEPSVKADGGGG